MSYSSISRYLLYVLIIICCGVTGALLAEAGGPAQSGPTATPDPEGTAGPTSTPVFSSQGCAECHLDVVSAWQEGIHAKAYSDPIFQEAWQAQGSQTRCLACHTTGFVANTGEYAHEGVTCEACHGQTLSSHPPEAVKVDPGVEVCAGCHTTTYNEWQHSLHGEQQLACTTCHQPHPQTLRFGTANELCLNCHNEEPRDDYTHMVHPDENCVDCHWFEGKAEDLQAHFVSGDLFPTGHTGKVETQSCVACHEELTETTVLEERDEALAAMNLSSNTQPLLEARVRIEELQAEVDTVKAQGANNSALRLVQGLIVGVVIGGVVVFGVARFRRSTTGTIHEKTE